MMKHNSFVGLTPKEKMVLVYMFNTNPNTEHLFASGINLDEYAETYGVYDIETLDNVLNSLEGKFLIRRVTEDDKEYLENHYLFRMYNRELTYELYDILNEKGKKEFVKNMK